MARVAIDANVLIAHRHERDRDHERGRELVLALERDDFPAAYILSSVLEETINYLHVHGTHEVAAETLDAIVESTSIEIVQEGRTDFDRGRGIFKRHEELSLTDGILVASMKRTGRKYLYSFDDDFDAVEGITRLNAPVNPYDE
jgi:predicted nucleic acid-binding protein